MSSQAILALSSLHLIAYEVNQEPNSLPTGSAQRDPSCDLCFFQTILRSGLWIPSRLMKTGDPFFASCALCASGPASARCACRAGHLIGASSRGARRGQKRAEIPKRGRLRARAGWACLSEFSDNLCRARRIQWINGVQPQSTPLDQNKGYICSFDRHERLKKVAPPQF